MSEPFAYARPRVEGVRRPLRHVYHGDSPCFSTATVASDPLQGHRLPCPTSTTCST